jgi:SpoVK/Ycf46/Vps4 family AAA+-type ATPase
MNAALLRRLFRAVSTGSPDTLRKLAATIVEDERRKGHAVLADELCAILGAERPVGVDKAPSISMSKSLGVLPTSRRHQEQLVQYLNPENLRHHMVLPPEVEARFRRVEREYAAGERLALYGLQPSRKILLYGPPGCGKSLGAERLAWCTGLPLVKVRFDSVMSSYFGESASNLRSVFEHIKGTPTLLFLDECDFVARSRNTTNDVGEAPRIVNALLALLDEYDSPGLLIAATNLDSALDRAIFRRFDEVFEVPLPGPEETLKLLKTTLSAIETAKNIDWTPIVVSLARRSAAYVVKAAQNAAKSAVLNGELPVTQHHIERSIVELNPNE